MAMDGVNSGGGAGGGATADRYPSNVAVFDRSVSAFMEGGVVRLNNMRQFLRQVGGSILDLVLEGSLNASVGYFHGRLQG